MIPHAYRVLLRDRRARRLLSGLGVSSVGDGLSIVTIAWLAVRTAPAGKLGLDVGLAVAAYTLPGANLPSVLAARSAASTVATPIWQRGRSKAAVHVRS